MPLKCRLPDHLILAGTPGEFICDWCTHPKRAATHSTLMLNGRAPGGYVLLCDEHAPAYARNLELHGQSVAVPAEWPADWRDG